MNREQIIEILTEFANEVIKAVSHGSGNPELIPEFADRLEQQQERNKGLKVDLETKFNNWLPGNPDASKREAFYAGGNAIKKELQ